MTSDISVIKMSSKGQIVIPQEMREGIEEGDKIVIIKNGSQIILKKMEDFDKNLKEDLEFAKRTEEAWKKYDRGEFVSMDSKEFLKALKQW
jgi:AbrB family looped-hinge helix DNA binding protein